MTPVEEFENLALPLRRELIAHCYRLTGSADEAEDLVQETYLRAWRSYARFEGRSSLRTWLYAIATNVCLRAIERRGRRPLPSGLGPPDDDPAIRVTAPALDVPWLQPFPGPAAGLEQADPAAVVASRAGLRLALIAGLQYLPARQRAVLILRDVLDWPAAEAARMLGMTTTAVNSALRRARTRLEQVVPAAEDIGEPSDPHWRDLADRYAAAFHDADPGALVTLLREDVTLEMPPLPRWFSGADAVGRFLAAHLLAFSGRFRLVPTVANGQPAFASYLRSDDGTGRAHAIQVLEVAGGQVTRIVIFLGTGLFTTFGLPLTCQPAAWQPAAWQPAAWQPAADR
jgi:RNA polymerase sigma-70 factor (ECF subfamily)